MLEKAIARVRMA